MDIPAPKFYPAAGSDLAGYVWDLSGTTRVSVIRINFGEYMVIRGEPYKKNHVGIAPPPKFRKVVGDLVLAHALALEQVKQYLER